MFIRHDGLRLSADSVVMNIETPELFNSVNTQTHIGWSEGEEGDE